MKKLTRGKVIVEQAIRVTSYLAIPKEHAESQKIEPGSKLYATVATIGGLRVLQYSVEKTIGSIEKTVTGYGGHCRISIPKAFNERYPHGKGSRYDVYTSATGSLLYEQLKES